MPPDLLQFIVEWKYVLLPTPKPLISTSPSFVWKMSMHTQYAAISLSLLISECAAKNMCNKPRSLTYCHGYQLPCPTMAANLCRKVHGRCDCVVHLWVGLSKQFLAIPVSQLCAFSHACL